MKYWTQRTLLFILLFCFGCHQVAVQTSMKFGSSESRWVKQTLSRFSLEEKIGQMLCLGFYGNFINRNSANWQKYLSWVKTLKIGGLAVYSGDVHETATMLNALQELSDTPLLIAANLERGLGNQLDGASEFPPIMSIGATGSEELSYRMGKITALEARAVGIHMAYFPVVDVNINPNNPIINTRSFGENPGDVGRLAVAFIKGCQENGLIATAKHFPGHGDTENDTHNVLAVVQGDLKRLQTVELLPFQMAVDAGVQAVMTAHISIPVLDPTPDLPATLSSPILTGLLRQKMGFNGIIVSDSMGMGGITTLYSQEQAAVQAVHAGVDIVLLSPEPEMVVQALRRAVISGQITEARIEESVIRILRAKAMLGLHTDRSVDVDMLDRKLAAPAHLQLAEKIYEQSMTLVKNDGDWLPLSRQDLKVGVYSLSSDAGGYFEGRPFVREIKKRIPNAVEFYAEASTGKEFLDEAEKTVEDLDMVLVALFSSLRSGKGSIGLNQAHVDFINHLVQGEAPVAVVSFGSPYYLSHFPDVDVYLCAYRPSPLAQATAARAVFGEIEVSGKLPVSIPGCYPAGHGLRLPNIYYPFLPR
jgi:beta-N-acetylhexosaminidase